MIASTTLQEWTSATWQELAMVACSAVVVYIAILLLTRMVGLRSFSKMSAADFAMTVAVGSLFASTVSAPSPSLIIGLASLTALFAGQWVVALLRKKSDRFSRLVDNEPLLLMSGRHFLDENMSRSNVTKEDIYGKLREANALNYDQVLAVVFETTGDIAVLHSSDPDARLEPDFMQNVIGSDRLDASAKKDS
ncbi:MAG: DUF421 domain-containing protein [Pirellulaceae bacterium]|nr:DUF421 domain-containing protein [Pirellulaceae bacterium]